MSEQVDSYLEAFELARKQGPVQSLTRFAPPPDDPTYFGVLGELVRLDLEFGWAEGRPTRLADYQQAFPGLFADEASARDIAYEEYRLRAQFGEQPTIAEYSSRGIDTTGWTANSKRGNKSKRVRPARSLAARISNSPVLDNLYTTGSEASDEATVDIPLDRARRPVTMRPDHAGQSHSLSTLLQVRLRLIAIGCAVVLAYFSALVLVNPATKVGFSSSVDSVLIVTANWVAFTACALLAAVLWTRRSLSVPTLRTIESALFGIMLVVLGLSLFSDLVLEHELREPFTQGDHALFHYGSSWSLPFGMLIVGYGTLVPSTWRRCIGTVAAMAAVPLLIGLAGGIAEGHLTWSFFQAFLLQMALWLTAASAVAVFGASRLDELHNEVIEARRLGQYRLTRRLGAGGMGEVYLGEHVLLRRLCAIKLIRPELAADPEALRNFEREVQITATLSHPNTVQVFDYGHTNDGRFYYVMEYLPGVTLNQAVERQGPLSPARVVHIVRQICAALHEAHAAGLVHRDIKPGNIILSDRGGLADVAKLLDFGLVLANAAERRERRSKSVGTLAGSPLYMSPEQAAGRSIVDGRADIYALGAVAYYLLCGQPPFSGETIPETLAAHIGMAVLPPRQIRPEIPQPLEDVVLRCLEKEPGLRFQDARSLDAALASCASLELNHFCDLQPATM